VLTLVEKIHAVEIELAQLEAAIELVSYYASEALRLHSVAGDDPELLLALRLLVWLQKQRTDTVELRDVYRGGPSAIRDVDTARKALKVLEEHRWVVRVPSRDVWTIVRGV
jgi:hypothetical protein